jgi:hypothetical protein
MMPITHRDAATLAEIRTRLAVSRDELARLLDPPRNEGGGGGEPGDYVGGFPRSRTMQLLMSGRGIGTLGALAAGLLMARPALALRLLRMLPASALARMILTRTFSALRAKHDPPP